MKKFVKSLLAFSCCAAAAVSVAACGGGKEDLPDLMVVAPDGAPALALVNAIAEEESRVEDSFDFKIVDANNIASFVTGDAPEADICIMPVNAAAKLLGSGDVYQMLGTVTNGNLYFLTTGEHATLTASEELLNASLLGKKIGVVKLADVPGLTLQVVLNQYHVPYQIVESTDAATATDKVNLIAFTPDNVTPAGGCDYYLCPEPAATAKINGTAKSETPFKLAGDLQALYGEEEGYPQAVAVAKKSVIESRKSDINIFLSYMRRSEDYLSDVMATTVLRHLDENRVQGLTPSFNKNNVTKEVIEHCSVRFHAAAAYKEKVITFLQQLMEVNASSTAIPSDAFFYNSDSAED